MVEATVEDKASGAATMAKPYYISSWALDPAFFAKTVGAPCGAENRLHWILNVVFPDHLMRPLTANGPKNSATVKHITLNLIKSALGKDSISVKRKAAGWDNQFLLAFIRSQNQGLSSDCPGLTWVLRGGFEHNYSREEDPNSIPEWTKQSAKDQYT